MVVVHFLSSGVLAGRTCPVHAVTNQVHKGTLQVGTQGTNGIHMKHKLHVELSNVEIFRAQKIHRSSFMLKSLCLYSREAQGRGLESQDRLQRNVQNRYSAN